MSDEKPSPGPWRWQKNADEVDGRLLDAAGRDIIAPSIHDGAIIEPADAALIADAWQLPQLREDIEEMLELLRNFEWAGVNECPDCAQAERHPAGHWPSCKLGALLDKRGRTP